MRLVFLLGFMALGGAWIDTFALLFRVAPTWQGVVIQCLFGVGCIFCAARHGVRLERDVPVGRMEQRK